MYYGHIISQNCIYLLIQRWLLSVWFIICCGFICTSINVIGFTCSNLLLLNLINSFIIDKCIFSHGCINSNFLKLKLKIKIILNSPLINVIHLVTCVYSRNILFKVAFVLNFSEDYWPLWYNWFISTLVRFSEFYMSIGWTLHQNL